MASVAGLPNARIEDAIRRHLDGVTVEETMLGVYHIAVGHRPHR